MAGNNGVERRGRVVRDAAARINNSASLLAATFGVLLIVLSAVIRDGVWPALFTIWGVGMIAIGLSAYTIIWWLKQ